jgi:predicted tellurium resistance membrane protein TerC
VDHTFRLPHTEWLSDPATWTALVTLFLLEVVLGVDNVIFISILAGKLPPEQQALARQLGLLLAAGTRVLFLLSISIIMQLKAPLFSVPVLNQPISGKDIILILGGLFLIYKATKEIHEKLEGEEGHVSARVAPTFAAVIAQVLLLDVVFSIDSVITAVGMADRIEVMIAAVLLSVGVMLSASAAIFTFVNHHPSVKILALSFLLLIGVSLMAEGFDAKIPKGYIYFAMAFSVLVELINIRASTRKAKPVHLHQPITEDTPAQP